MFKLAFLRWGLLGVSAGAAVACGGSGASTLSPSNLATVTGVSMALVNPPGVGANVTASGFATLSSGNTVTLSQGYTSDTPSVATVTSAGVMTGVSIGDVTISLDYQGFHASKRLRVLPNYSGIFSGTYKIDGCTDTGAFIDTALRGCKTIPAGSTPQIALNSAQAPDLTTLTGQFALGGLFGNSTGTIASNGALSYSGSVTAGTERIEFRNFTATSPAVGQIAGSFELVFSDSALTGNSVWVCTIQTLNRTSGAATTELFGAASRAPATVGDLVARVLSRR